MVTKVKAVGPLEKGGKLEVHEIERREPGEDDVAIEITHCGICHSDLHTAHGDWGATKDMYPMVTGHEIVGIVKQVGKNVTKFKAGDRVGVGCMVDSCRDCASCRSGDEQYCVSGFTGTYGSKRRYKSDFVGKYTNGGYSTDIVVDQDFVLNVPDNMELAEAAPLLCAGITTYSPLVHYNLRANQRLAVAGMGGLGHMAVKFGLAMGAHVTVLSRGTAKKEDALKMGAHDYIDVKDAAAVKAAANSFDLLVDSISAQHDVMSYLGMVKPSGTMVLLGVPPAPYQIAAGSLVMSRKSLAGSLIGGIRETQEMLDFCARHDIRCEIEMTTVDKVNEAWERTEKGDVRFRFVIDMDSLRAA
ncbi:NADP-dependent alcohol dehydrogenase C 2 (Ms-ADHC 2) [Durusdinium trenchii]|uniref:NADP-dependent alcohol dehydrogenase C 2 (Ms-ADHC 2) n=1 Tax=Durusdinium trenchii TaxID=1381693 RepID=A0ABP0PWZ2_9DINO